MSNQKVKNGIAFYRTIFTLIVLMISLAIIILLLVIKYGPSKGGNKDMNVTWSTPKTFQYDGNQHELTVSGYPTGATVTYTGGEDGANGATAVGSYTINAEITAAGYNKWEGSETLSITTAPMPTITWSTPDSFVYDGSSHTISVSGYPTGSTVTYTGGQDGANGATAVGSYTINVSITNPNYQTYTGSHTLTISNSPFATVYIDTKTSNIAYGYSSSSWTQDVVISPTPDSFTYSFDSIDSALSGKLTIDPSSTASSVKLNLATGVAVGQYNYTIKVVATKTGYASGIASTPCVINITSAPMPTITWSTPDSFAYDGSSHTISVSGYPTGSTVTYTGGEDGANGATAVGSYTINVSITNPNYQTYTGSHTLTITAAPNYIKLNDGSEIFIDVTGSFCTNRGASGTFDFKDVSGTDQTITRTDIKEIHLVSLPVITSAPNSYLQYLCSNMSNLTVADIIIPAGITTVGNYFCSNMFQACTSLATLPSTFNIPTGITTAGVYFCESMFVNCGNLTSLPTNFNIPTGITTASNSFCGSMFYGCDDLTSVPSTFNIPTGITTVGTDFCSRMFYNCKKLSNPPVTLPTGITTVGNSFCNEMFYGCESSTFTALPSTFNIPTGITTTNNKFCFGMFQGCKNLASLPTSFNLPTGITNAGEQFCTQMFQGCSALSALPSNFNIPSGITSAPFGFAQSMFQGCSTLSALPTNFAIPSGITSVGGAFCDQMFYGCSALNNIPSTVVIPTGISGSVPGAFCHRMFENCTSLTSLPSTFLIPSGITTVADNFCGEMFEGCSALASLPSNFNIPTGITSENTYFCAKMFTGCSSLTQLPTNFNIPQGITEAKYGFINEMFRGTGLTSLPANFNLPTGITTIGDMFCYCTFAYISSLATLPTGFNFPTGVTAVGSAFCNDMFRNTNLTSLPTGFNIPTGLTSVGSNFCVNMFTNNKFTSLPTGFNIPTGITTVGDQFCYLMFSGCNQLDGLPSGFNIPQGISGSVGQYFCGSMFTGCSSLGNTSGSTITIHIPNCTGTNFCNDMFGGTGITPTTPLADTDINIDMA